MTNVTAQQIANTGQVRITFDVADADGDQVTARVICSSNGDATYDLLPVSLSGDVNHAMSAGPGKQIIWNAGSDYPGRYWPHVVAKVVCTDGPSLSGEMVSVAGGTYTIGSGSGYADNAPLHLVTVSQYWIDKYEVTNADFQRFIDAGGYTTQAFWSAAGWSWRTVNGVTQPAAWGSDSYHTGPAWPGFPVAGVTWYEAEAYANFAGKRLPTEAEWEIAARGPSATTYAWGNAGWTPDRANFPGGGQPFGGLSTPVGFYNGQTFPSPPFATTNSPSWCGTYDQSGNVSEWVSDWYDPNYYATSPGTNPSGPLTGGYKVVRGSGWLSVWHLGSDPLGVAPQAFIRNDFVNFGYTSPDRYSIELGFRCARTGP